MPLKVVMTLGPASSAPATLRSLLVTADRLRINAAHVDEAQLRHWLDRLKRLYADSGRELPVVLDLQGAKMRIGSVPTVTELPPTLRLVNNGRASPTAAVIGVPHPELFEQVIAGEELTLNDGRVRIRVDAVTPEEIRAQVIVNGPLSSHKGINRIAHPISIERLSDRDGELVEVAEEYPFVEYAYSFVVDGHEAEILRGHTSRRVVAKIERPEAMEHLSAIDQRFDELWFCRGDLGEQAGIHALGELQHEISARMRELAHPVYLAGQVLEHMTRCEHPTRSEVVHLWDVERAGWQGVVLSDETAVGDHPEAVAAFIDAWRKG